jgi:uncharacterized protein YggE
MRTLALAVLALSALTAPLFAQPEPDRHRPKPPTISVSGTARVERTPDYVDVSLGITAPDKTASQAQQRASQVMDAAIKALRALKLPGEDLQTGRVDLHPNYEHRPDRLPGGEPIIVGYTASNTIRVRTTDLEAVPRIIDTALQAGCNRVEYVTFGIKEAIEAREEAIRLAAQAARRKAYVLADALGLEIVSVENASTNAQVGAWMGQTNRMAQMVASPMAEGGDQANPVVPGKVEIWADANISFIARPRNAPHE